MLLNGKSCFHILRPTKAFTLGFHALVAYSLLVRRFRLSIPVSQRDVISLTGFSHHTLTKVESVLLQHGLVLRDGYNLIPQPDTQGLFHVKGKGTERWEDRYQTTIIYDLAPTSPLTPIANYVFCTVLSFNANGKIPTTAAIAQLLCLSERTVKDKVKALRKKGLIDRDDLCATIKDSSYWLDGEPKKTKNTLVIDEDFAKETAATFLSPILPTYQPRFISSMEDWEALVQSHAIEMLRANYSEDDLWEFWRNVDLEWSGRKMPVIEKFSVHVFGDLFKLVEYQTSLNRGKGFRGKNSCGLLSLWAKAVCIDLLARYNHSPDAFVDYTPDLEKVKFKAAK